MLKMEEIILLNLSVAAEMSSAKPTDKTMKKYLQKCIHISRLVIKGKLDLALFEEFFTTRFPEKPLNENYAEEYLDRFIEGMEWQKGDYATRRILQKIAPDIYPTDLDDYFTHQTLKIKVYSNMKVEQSQFIDFLTDENYWESAICTEAGTESFGFLCLDGQMRILFYDDYNIKWRFPE